MLGSLAMRDLVFPGTTEVHFTAGLCVLTGETGAGKSLLLNAQALALGGRASARLVAPGCREAHSIASFTLADGHPALTLLEARGIACSGQIILRRIQGADGATRAFANDVPVSVALLRDVAALLTEVHGQHDARHLHDPSLHCAMLDGFGALMPQLAKVREAHAKWREAQKELEAFIRSADEYAERAQAAQAALDEFALLKPEAGLEAKLAAERNLLRQGDAIRHGLHATLAETDDGGDDTGEKGALVRLHRLVRELEQIAEQAPGSIDAMLAALTRACAELEEARETAAGLFHLTKADPEQIERIEERLFALRELARKYQTSTDGLLALKDKLEEDAAKGKNIKAEQARLEKICADAEQAYRHEAGRLSKARKKAALEMTAAVNRELPPLRLANARFAIDIETEGNPSPEGMDKVRFLVATAPGRKPDQLQHIASGGELSRLMLALKLVSAARQGAGTLIFDEIDAGLSGAAAEAVGIRLAQLARSVQVLVVTHAPQVAAHAAHHIRVVKAGRGDKLSADVAVLEGRAREEEIARMIAGVKITDEARAAARRLMAS